MQRKQYLVKLNNSIEGNKFIKYLEDNGLKNVHNVSQESLRIKVLVVDENVFFSTNVTCLSAAAIVGIKPISIEEFKEEFEYQFNITNNLQYQQKTQLTNCVFL